jgi:nitroimidazol reductase NimA-like FMN-containing flavoprotein (pyridoxamine 5'-phosphate oxidase superfamily)
MKTEPQAFDPDSLARRLVADNAYLTLATAGADGVPWASPVWFAARELEVFVWASSPLARHSRNIAENPQVSFVIFDSSKPPGAARALYVSARAELVGEPAFDEALAMYSARSVEQGLAEWDSARLRAPAKHRLYRAVAFEAFVLDGNDERVKLF